MKHSYHAHHAPMGACGSFLLGLNGAAGGFVADATGGATQDVFVGYRYAGEPWTLLPFVREETARAARGTIALLPHGRYGRTLGWATDRWMAQALVLLLATPFDSIAEADALDAARRRLLLTPAVHGLLDFDNSHMDVSVELVCAIGDADRAWRVIAGAGEGGGLVAVACAGGSCGFAANATPGVAVTAFSGDEILGVPAAGLVFRIQPAGKAVIPLAIGFGAGVEVTLSAALSFVAEARALAQKRDDELRASGLPEDARRQVSLATREFLATEPVRASIDLSLAAMRQRAGV